MNMQKITTSACQEQLPQVLIDYLWQLAGEGEGDTGVHSFVLSPKYVGGGQVQDILHRHNNFSSWRRVFGYPPVQAVVQVQFTGQRALMSLADGAPAPTRVTRGEDLARPA